MDEAMFEKAMRDADDILATRNVPALQRPFLAWFHITGKEEFVPLPRDPEFSKFDGPNLYHEIEQWYVERYPHHATIQSDWGHRWFVVRGEYFRARMPLIFNPAGPLDPFEFIEQLPTALVDLLTEAERQELVTLFNAFFRQASNLNLCRTVRASSRPGTITDFIERGWADLRDAGTAFMPNDPTSILFTIQQASEKYLKAILLISATVANEDELRKKFGHRIRKLFDASLAHAPTLAPFAKHVDLLDYDPSVRYQRPTFSPKEVIGRLNLSYAICNAVARRLLDLHAESNV
jgi:hypothetical protein